MNIVNQNPFSYENLLILVTKQKIFAAKCMKKTKTIHAIVNEFECIHEIKYKNAIKTCNSKKYNLRWPDKIKKSNANEIIETI